MPIVYDGSPRIFDMGLLAEGAEGLGEAQKETAYQDRLKAFYNLVDNPPSKDDLGGMATEGGAPSGRPAPVPAEAPPSHGYDPELDFYWEEKNAKRSGEAHLKSIQLALDHVDQRDRPRLQAYAEEQLADNALGQALVRTSGQIRDSLDQGEFTWGGSERKLATASAREQQTQEYLEEALTQIEEDPSSWSEAELDQLREFAAEEKAAALESNIVWGQIDYTTKDIDRRIAAMGDDSNIDYVMDALRIKEMMLSRKLKPADALLQVREALSGNAEAKRRQRDHEASVYTRLNAGVITQEQADALLASGPAGGRGGQTQQGWAGANIGGLQTAITGTPPVVPKDQQELLDAGLDEGKPTPTSGISGMDLTGAEAFEAVAGSVGKQAVKAGEWVVEHADEIVDEMISQHPVLGPLRDVMKENVLPVVVPALNLLGSRIKQSWAVRAATSWAMNTVAEGMMGFDGTFTQDEKDVLEAIEAAGKMGGNPKLTRAEFGYLKSSIRAIRKNLRQGFKMYGAVGQAVKGAAGAVSNTLMKPGKGGNKRSPGYSKRIGAPEVAQARRSARKSLPDDAQRKRFDSMARSLLKKKGRSRAQQVADYKELADQIRSMD